MLFNSNLLSQLAADDDTDEYLSLGDFISDDYALYLNECRNKDVLYYQQVNDYINQNPIKISRLDEYIDADYLVLFKNRLVVGVSIFLTGQLLHLSSNSTDTSGHGTLLYAYTLRLQSSLSFESSFYAQGFYKKMGAEHLYKHYWQHAADDKCLSTLAQKIRGYIKDQSLKKVTKVKPKPVKATTHHLPKSKACQNKPNNLQTIAKAVSNRTRLKYYYTLWGPERLIKLQDTSTSDEAADSSCDGLFPFDP